MSAISLITSATDVFGFGSYNATLVDSGSCSLDVQPPKPMLIGTPVEAGEFPILLFLHGYLLFNSFYSQLLKHVASHGFIVIAPQLYNWAGKNATGDIHSAANIADWLSKGLLQQGCLLPTDVKPNLRRLALGGHSRGGKVAFALALNETFKFSALIGVDPVDGLDGGEQTPPPVLTFVPHSFNLDGMPVMVIGSGLGEVKGFPLLPACAPKGLNHEEFFRESRQPACYFVAKEYGHLDTLDDVTEGIRGWQTYWCCKNGKAREPMRRFVGGVIVAFLNAYLNGDNTDLIAIRDRHVAAPVGNITVVCPV